ncbi:MAG: AAC(3) family N-acetyltransferase [Ruminococcaceae bacterium]|nr:AAC(3) family N-acetyltransferase [Oscillospiraceae bacterium]
MYTKDELKKQLEAMNIPHDATLLIHSSMKAVGEIEGGAETLLDCLCEHLSDGLLVMPTHTWDTIDDQHNVFNPATEPSCVGILGMLLLKREGAVRSLHPTHSVAAWGKDAAAFVAGEHFCETPCARNGCMGKLLDRHGLIMFLGCPLTKNTFLHGVEEWCGIENRLGEPKVRFIVMPNGEQFMGTMRGHCAPVPDVSQNYGKMEQPFLQLGAAEEYRLGDARCVLCKCEDMVRITSELLIICPDLFLDNEPVSSELLGRL